MDLPKQKQLTRFFEATRRHCYRDSAGILTIGVGRNVDKQSNGPGLRSCEIEFMLENDIKAAYSEALSLIRQIPDISDVREAVIVDMILNIGLPRFSGFKRLIEASKIGDWGTVAVEMENSNWWTQVGRRGPILKQMILSDMWPEIDGPEGGEFINDDLYGRLS